MAFSFIKFIKKLFPKYFWVVDTYKDLDGTNGFWERYVGIFETELDENIYPFIRDVLNILDSTLTPQQYLIYLNYMMGDVPDTGDEAIQRKLLKWIVRLWQKKGTIPGFEMLFRLFGLGVKVVEHYGPKPVKYDNEPLNYYDTEGTLYDINCSGCTDIELAYWDLNDGCLIGTPTEVPENTLKALQKLICLLLPIDVNFKGFIKRYGVCDSISIDVTEGDDHSGPTACSMVDINTVTIGNTYGGCTFESNNFQASSVIVGEGALTWDLSGGPGILGFEIEISISGQNQWMLLVYTLPTINQYTVENLSPNISYDFRLRIRKEAGHCYWQYANNIIILAEVCTIPNNIQIHNTI